MTNESIVKEVMKILVRKIRCMYSTKQCICTNVIFNSSYANSYLNIHRDDLKMRKVYNMKIHRNFSASY